MSLRLDEIVPWGRSRKEYELMFNLSTADYAGGILDCAGGPASFNAETTADGLRVVSVDPIYAFSGTDIRKRFDATADSIMSQVRAAPEAWTWQYHRDPDDLCKSRHETIAIFLDDYDEGLSAGRYITGELPALPVASDAFALGLCSHLLFLYSDLLSAEFHVQSVLELCRVAVEVRIFPLLTLAGKTSPHLEVVRSALQSHGWSSEIVRVDYELQRGGNQMLRIFRR